jgi:WD40 repeat protein
MSFIDYYELLQVSPKAHLEVIKSAYRTMMSKLNNHPDKGGDEEKAKLLNEAISILSDESKRRNYDTLYNNHYNSNSTSSSNGKELKNIHTLYGHNTAVDHISIGYYDQLLASFSKSGSAEKGFLGSIFGAQYPNEIKLWNLQSGEELRSIVLEDNQLGEDGFLLDKLNVFKVNKTQNSIAFGTDSYLSIVDLTDDSEIYNFEHGLQKIDFDENLSVMSLALERSIQIYDIYKGQDIANINIRSMPDLLKMDKKIQLIASHIHGEGMIHIYDIQSQKKMRSIPSNKYVHEMILDINTKMGILAISNLHKITFWNMFNGNQLNEIYFPNSTFCFSHNEDIIALGDANGLIRVIDLSSFEEIKISQAHNAKITQVEFSLDDKKLVSGSEDNTIKIWSL